jgi:phage major head subunit gpT-like protein
MSSFILGPAVENPAKYADAQIAFHAAFMNYLEKEGQDPLEALYMELTSTTAQESHLFVGDVPGFQEWLENREMGSIAMHRIDVRNRNFASGIPIHRNQIEDDQLGLIMPSLQRLAGKAKRHPGKLIAERLINGFAGNLFSGDAGDGTTYDGALMFSAVHTLEGGPNQSNTLGATALSYASLETAITKMRGFTTYDGQDPLEVEPTHLVVGPALEFTAKRILEQDLTVLVPGDATATFQTGGQTNIHKGRLKLVVSPRIRNYPNVVDASKYWYVAALNESVKPFIFQKREPITTAMQVGWESPEMFQKGILNFGAQARYETANFDWRLIVGSTGA